MGTLIDTQTVLTAAHSIVNLNPGSLNISGTIVPVVTNSYYPTFASMFTVTLGLQDITDISTAQNMSVSQLIPVILKLFEILNLL